MLRDFLLANGDEIAARARQLLSQQGALQSDGASTDRDAAIFLGQVATLLGPGVDGKPRMAVSSAQLAALCDGASLRGQQWQKDGLTSAELVEGYADLRQLVMQWANAAEITIDHQDLQLFNRCVDFALASAVTTYCAQRDRELTYRDTERRGILAHEMRNLLNTTTLSFAVIREGKVGLGGSTGAMLARSLSGLCALVDRSLAEVRLATRPPKLSPISMVEFIEEVQVSAAAHAEGYGLQLTVHPVDRDLRVAADWQLLESAVSNLLQNAFKFTRPSGSVSLVTGTVGDRVLIEVHDQCGGLETGACEKMFRPFSRGDRDRSGLGLGLYVAQDAARANGGEIHVRDDPGTGCVFTIELPRTEAHATGT